MYSLIVTMTVRDDQCQEFEQAMQDLAAAVKTHEPGALGYHVLRTRNARTRYRVLEIYASKDAFKAHLASEHVVKMNPRVLATLAGAPEFEVLEVVA